MIAESLLECVGDTPLLHISRVARVTGVDAVVLVKCEHLNVTGSHKIRPVRAMFAAAERRGDLTAGSGQTVLLATGGNLGKGAAVIAALRGYKLVLTIPDDYSATKIELLRACGATVFLADHKNGGNAHGELAMWLAHEHPDWILVNQFNDLANVAGHKTTGLEILTQLEGRTVDAFVACVGSAGHLMGIAPVLLEHLPTMEVVGVQPVGCDIEHGVFCEHPLQGMAVGAIPPLLDPDIVQRWISISEHEAMVTLHHLVRLEGLMVGISSAATVAAALQVATEMPGRTVLTVVYDSLTDYPELFHRLISESASLESVHPNSKEAR